MVEIALGEVDSGFKVWSVVSESKVVVDEAAVGVVVYMAIVELRSVGEACSGCEIQRGGE